MLSAQYLFWSPNAPIAWHCLWWWACLACTRGFPFCNVMLPVFTRYAQASVACKWLLTSPNFSLEHLCDGWVVQFPYVQFCNNPQKLLIGIKMWDCAQIAHATAVIKFWMKLWWTVLHTKVLTLRWSVLNTFTARFAVQNCFSRRPRTSILESCTKCFCGGTSFAVPFLQACLLRSFLH